MARRTHRLASTVRRIAVPLVALPFAATGCGREDPDAASAVSREGAGRRERRSR